MLQLVTQFKVCVLSLSYLALTGFHFVMTDLSCLSRLPPHTVQLGLQDETWSLRTVGVQYCPEDNSRIAQQDERDWCSQTYPYRMADRTCFAFDSQVLVNHYSTFGLIRPSHSTNSSFSRSSFISCFCHSGKVLLEFPLKYKAITDSYKKQHLSLFKTRNAPHHTPKIALASIVPFQTHMKRISPLADLEGIDGY